MKKSYTKPLIKVVQLKKQAALLQSSVGEVYDPIRGPLGMVPIDKPHKS